MSESRPGPRLRIAVLGDFDGMHTHRWLEVFVQRGHDVHAISYYQPAVDLPGARMHVLSGRPARDDSSPNGTGSRSLWEKAGGGASILRGLMPQSLQRLIQARRYMRTGLGRVLDEIQPDVFHAHYAVEHGFYGAFANYHPYVVSAWGSDLLVESYMPLGKLIARRALRHADLVTANDASLARRAVELGVPKGSIEVVHLGIDQGFLDAGEHSVNLRSSSGEPPTLISDRALEPLYNVDMIIRAFARLRDRLPLARLIVAHDGSQREELEALAREIAPEGSIAFTGRLAPDELAATLSKAHVYVSVPSSDSLALSTVEAMATGCFPVVSDLPSNEGWITHGANGFIVPIRVVERLADALFEALTNDSLRLAALAPNRAKVEADGLRERNMLRIERLYYRLADYLEAGDKRT